MKTTFLLLSPKILSFKNSITLKSFSKRLPFLLIGIIFWLGFYTGTCKVLYFIRSILFFGEILSKKLLSITFFSLGIFLILSNIITALSSFYMSRDVPFLMSKPLKTKEILRLKTIETISGSSWMVISFIPPFFIAYGINYNAPCLFYLVLILTFVPFLLITSGIGIPYYLPKIIFDKNSTILAIDFFYSYLYTSSVGPNGPSVGNQNAFTLSIKTDLRLCPVLDHRSVMPLLKHRRISISSLICRVTMLIIRHSGNPFTNNIGILTDYKHNDK
jgi:hypothetical protein